MSVGTGVAFGVTYSSFSAPQSGHFFRKLALDVVAADGAGPVQGYGLTPLVLSLVGHATLLESGYLTNFVMVLVEPLGYATGLPESRGCEIISLT